MKPEDAEGWAELLTDEQKGQLKWLQDHRCMLEASYAPPDPLQDSPAGLVLEVKVDRHAVTKIRGDNVPEMFAFLYRSARALFEYVEQHDPLWRGAQ